MKYFVLFLTFFAFNIKGISQTVTPHPVPEEFNSDYYRVTVNGQSVPIFHAGLNVYFASFYFINTANVIVQSNSNTDKYSGQTSNKEIKKLDETGYWKGEVFLRPLSKNIKPTINGLEVSFSLTEARQY